jgi:cytidylate kinase
MDNASSRLRSGTLSPLIERAFRHWEARRRAAAAQRDLSPRTGTAFTIAIEREAGTQGTNVAKEVARRLGWHVYDHELLEEIARDMGLRTNLLESVDERQQSWLIEMAEAFLSAPRTGDWGPLVTESGFVQHLIKTVLALGAHGEAVIVGRGAGFILPPATTVRVRLVGPVRERIAALGKNLGLTEHEAARRVRKLDRERADFVQDHFLKDPTDPHNYDLVLNALRLTIAQSAEVIVAALERFQDHAEETGAVPTLTRTAAPSQR